MRHTIAAPRPVGCTIALPTSKSISNRLLLLNVLCRSSRLPANLSASDDTAVMLKALQSDMSHVDVGAAGTSMRFLTAYLATLDGRHTITGSERMKQRPIGILVDALRQLGARIDYAEAEGYPPLHIEGRRLTGGVISLPGNVSSQYISALMMVAPVMEQGLELHLEGKVISQPYIAMTQRLMTLFGIAPEWDGRTIRVPHGSYRHAHMQVEADWSAASYWYAIAALAPGCRFTLEGLERDSSQGDSAVADIARRLGVQTTFVDGGIEIARTADPEPTLHYDFNRQPDLTQTFVVLCCLMGVHFSFGGVESLRIKETDRMAALTAEMAKLGYGIDTNGTDTLEWNGRTTAPAPGTPVIDTYKDHRMAMAFAPAALLRPIIIDDPMVVTKSYPTFWDHLAAAGFDIDTQD